MKQKLSEALGALEQEVSWCIENPDSDLSKDYQAGFVAGLKQAQGIIRAVEAALTDIVIVYRDGEPCSHRGCRAHISHPCELCGRRASRGEVIALPNKRIIWS